MSNDTIVISLPGDHEIHVHFYGQVVKGSPFISKAYNTGKLLVSNMPQYCLPGNPVSFDSKDALDIFFFLLSFPSFVFRLFVFLVGLLCCVTKRREIGKGSE